MTMNGNFHGSNCYHLVWRDIVDGLQCAIFWRLWPVAIRATGRLLISGIAAALAGQTAVADDAGIRFKLPSCPTEMTLFATDAFRGAVMKEELLEALQPFLFAETKGVFAARSPEKPDIALLVVEPNRISEVQGTISAEQFNQVKAAMLAKNPSSAVVEANEILKEKDTVINEYDGIVQSSTNTSATVSLVLDGTVTGADFASLTGFKMIYADRCLVGVILIAPKLSIARREFEEMIKLILVE
jgi:hypothetical protein